MQATWLRPHFWTFQQVIHSFKFKRRLTFSSAHCDKAASSRLAANQTWRLHSHLDQRVVDLYVGFHESPARHHDVIRGGGGQLGVEDAEQRPQDSHVRPDHDSQHFRLTGPSLSRAEPQHAASGSAPAGLTSQEAAGINSAPSRFGGLYSGTSDFH